MNLLAKKLSKFFKKKGKHTNRSQRYANDHFRNDAGKVIKEKEEKKEKKKEKNELICYECKKPGHIKYVCPVLIKKMEKYKLKQKALMATWSDLDELDAVSHDTSDDTEEANLCLMALSEVTSDSDDDMLESIRRKLKKLLKGLSKANEKIDALKNEKEVLMQTNQLLVDENDILKNDKEVLQIDNEKFRDAQTTLEKENSKLHSEIKDLKQRMDAISKDLSTTFISSLKMTKGFKD